MATTSRPLTGRQQELLSFIIDFLEDHGYQPTIQEMADAMDVTRNAVFGHLKALQRKGVVGRVGQRALRLLAFVVIVRPVPAVAVRG